MSGQQRALRSVVLTVLVLSGLMTSGASPAGSFEQTDSNIDAYILDQIAAQGRANVFVKMASDAPLEAAELMTGRANRAARRQFVYDRLTAHAASSQAAVQVFLSGQGVRFRSYWINNSLYVFGADLALVRALARRSDVAYLRGDHLVALHRPVAQSPAAEIEAVEWGVALINADDVWAGGNTGAGVVVASIDTGVRYTHEALVNQYRGNNGDGTFDHDYNWHDPDGAIGFPGDLNGHGTHTMGTMVGGDGLGPLPNDVGVAPGARWIAAQGCDGFFCTDSDLISSAEWIACPTRVDGSDPDCAMAPDVVNNSWGGTGGDAWYTSYVNSWTAAGIMPVFSAGNSGSACRTMGSPGDYRKVLGVGATDINDLLADFSSKGPGLFRRTKPDLVAPGVNVRSSYSTSDTTYALLSGTSMAAPHTAGTIALMLGANSGATLPELITSIKGTTVQGLGAPPGPDSCGGVSYDVYPNYIYGSGRIDAAAAVADIGP